MDCSTPVLSVLHHLLEFAHVHVHWIGGGGNGKSTQYSCREHTFCVLHVIWRLPFKDGSQSVNCMGESSSAASVQPHPLFCAEFHHLNQATVAVSVVVGRIEPTLVGESSGFLWNDNYPPLPRATGPEDSYPCQSLRSCHPSFKQVAALIKIFLILCQMQRKYSIVSKRAGRGTGGNGCAVFVQFCDSVHLNLQAF